MHIKKLLSVTLALVMLCGSVPLGFSEPLRVQLEQGIETESLHCDNPNHVLVQRSSTKLACVTERTAEKTGWEIINKSSTYQVDYKFPLSSKDYQTEQTSEPVAKYGDFEITLSNLPMIGDTAEITINFTANRQINDQWLQISITNNEFEFVDVPTESIKSNERHSRYSELMNLEIGETVILSATVRAISEGYGQVGATATQSHGYTYYVHIDNAETLLQSDYYKKHPQFKPSPQIFSANGDKTEPPPQEKPQPRQQNHTNPENSKIDMTEEVMREKLKKKGYTDKEIEIIINSKYHPKASTQSFSFLQPAYATSHEITLEGYLKTNTSPFAPTDIFDITDANVCAWDYDSTTNQYLAIGCDSTDEDGYYSIYPVSVSSESQDGQLDLLVSFSTNGAYSQVKNAETIGDPELGDIYQIMDTSDIWTDPTSDISYSVTLDTSDLTTANENRAFWITDGIADARIFFSDKFGISISNVVNVGWQYNNTANDGFGLGSEGARYYSSGGTLSNQNTVSKYTMYLDGQDISSIRDDDSDQRWTIIHEYAHHTMNDVFTTYPDTDPNNDDSCDGHTFDNPSNTGCAWTEGWADVLPSLVDNSSEYTIVENFILYLEKDQYFDDGLKNFPTVENSADVGQISEGQVASAIWDLYDSAYDSTNDNQNGGLDDVSAGFLSIGTIFDTKPDNIEGFYTNWQTTAGYSDSDNVMKLHYMSFISTTTENTAPVVSDQTVALDQDSSLSITLIGTDSDGDTLTYSIVTNPSDGTLTTGYTEQYQTYTPDSGFSGTDSFTFLVNDGTQDSNTATVSITVTELDSTSILTEIINAVINYLIDTIQIQFDTSIATDFSASDFNVIATLDDGTTETLTVTSVTNYSVASAYRTLSISEIPSNTIHLYVDATNSNLVNLGGDAISDVTPFDSDVDSEEIIVEEINVKPYSDAGDNQSVLIGDIVTLDGTASYDSNGDSLTYYWEQTDTTGYNVDLSDNNSSIVTFTAPDVSTYTQLKFTLTATEQTDEALSDTDSVNIYVSVPSTSRDADWIISNPNPTDYDRFGQYMDADNDVVLVGMGTTWVAWYSESSSEFISEPGDIERVDSETDVDVLFVGDNLVSINGTEFNLLDTVFLNSTQSIDDISNVFTSSESEGVPSDGAVVVLGDMRPTPPPSPPRAQMGDGPPNKIAPPPGMQPRAQTGDGPPNKTAPSPVLQTSSTDSDLESLVLVVDETNNMAYLVNSSTEPVVFASYWGYAYVIDVTDGSVSVTTQGLGTSNSDFGEYGMALFDSNNFVVSDRRVTSDMDGDNEVFSTGLVHIYENVSGSIDQATRYIENPENNRNDYFGENLITVGADQIVISGGDLNYLYLYDTTGTLINAYSPPDGSAGDFDVNSMASFGTEKFVVEYDGDVYVYSVASTAPLLTISVPSDSSGFASTVYSIATNIEKNWILVGSNTAAYLFDGTDGSLIQTFENSDSTDFGYSVAFVGNKIIVGAPDNDPNGNNNAGSIYIFSPVDGSLLETINNDSSNEDFGYFVSGIKDSQYFLVSAPEYNSDLYADEGRLLVYSNINNSPIANADSNLNQAENGDTVTLDATASFDLDADDLDFSWLQTDDNISYTITLSNNTSSTPTFTAPTVLEDTVLTFEVTVSDGVANNTDSVDVTILAPSLDTTPPVITLDGDNPQTIELGNGYTELGASTDDGSDVTIDSTAFVDAVGSYSITYDSTDSSGNAATTVTRTVNVISYDVVPWSTADSANNHLNAVSMSDSTNGVAVGLAGTIVYTNDGGATWSVTDNTDGIDSLYAVSMSSTTQGVAVGYGGEIVYTNNGGNTWSKGDSETSNSLTGVSMSDSTNGVAVGYFGEIIYTNDGGNTWSDATHTIDDDTYLWDVSMSDSVNGVAVGSKGTVIYTNDGGATWETGNSGLSNDSKNRLTGVSMTSATDGVAVGWGGTIIYTTNGGETWTSSSDAEHALTSVSMYDSNNGIAVGIYGLVIYTDDGGLTWNDTTNTIGDSYLWGVSMSSTSSGVAVGDSGIVIYTFNIVGTLTDDDTSN